MILKISIFMFWVIFSNIDWKMNFNYSVHLSFKNYVISKEDPRPPYVTYQSSVWGTTALPYFDDVIYAQPLSSSIPPKWYRTSLESWHSEVSKDMLLLHFCLICVFAHFWRLGVWWLGVENFKIIIESIMVRLALLITCTASFGQLAIQYTQTIL